MYSDVIGLVALDLVLRVFLARMVHVSFVIHVLRVHPDNSAAHSSGLRIPTHPVTPLQSLWTGGHVVNPRRRRRSLAAIAVTFIILALGWGIGLSFASPYSGPSATTMTIAAAV
jgi:hypothetical protein